MKTKQFVTLILALLVAFSLATTIWAKSSKMPTDLHRRQGAVPDVPLLRT